MIQPDTNYLHPPMGTCSKTVRLNRDFAVTVILNLIASFVSHSKTVLLHLSELFSFGLRILMCFDILTH